VVDQANILTDWPADGPKVLWSVKVDAGFGGAAVQDGKVYLLDREGTDGDVLRALDLDNGKQLWTCGYEAPGRLSYPGTRSTPTLTKTHAFTVGSLGHITCIDLEKREIAWQKHMDEFGAFPPKWGWSQSPLLIGDLVIIAPMAEQAGLVAMKQKTGEVVWKSGNIGNEGYCSPHLVELAGKKQIVYFTSRLASGVDPTTGKVLWQYDGIPVKRAIPTPTAIGDNKLFITGGYDAGSALIEVTRNGDDYQVKQLQRDEQHGGQVHAALLIGEHLYVNLNTNENLRRGPAHGLGCFDLNGKLVWKSDNKPDLNRGPVLGVGSKLLTLGGEDGVLRLVQASPNGYQELAAAKIFSDLKARGNNIWGPMALADGRLLVRSQNELKCIDLRPESLARQAQ
ncbi:MAG: PQQ-like beta-propeller repeat protein, partial [Rhodospirillales bacterium]|nr:PQQ-like beta-propeller repeat protein [Rhodospirillales bacterium]